MATLSSTERSRLEKATLAARNAAEAGVRKRFDALDLTSDRTVDLADRPLRNALRKRARDLGRGRVDNAAENGSAMEKGVPFLVEELAYETWHRMLFARMLAENGLLTHPEFGVALSIDDVKALAADDEKDPWDLASEFAANRLPGLFHLSIPLRLTSEDRQALSKILNDMDTVLFTASDALGWGYQFWQAKRKEEVNASGEKINGNTLSPVTQLFTEDYIVDFLLQNSLGAWYVARNPETPLRHDWPFLRFRDDGSPAAGTFPTWSETVAAVTVMDPCCGSGHFLVAAFQMLVAMRQEAEGLSPADAADAVLRSNLYGLELDARCTQIATFAVALEAWKLGGHPEANLPHIACSGIPVSGQEKDWQRLAGGDDHLKNALTALYKQFAQASELGSLIDPRRVTRIEEKRSQGQYSMAMPLPHEWDTVERKLLQALERERSIDPAAQIFADDDLVGTVRAAQLLSRNYTLVATNVPYLSRGSHSEKLRKFADETYPEAKNDLATLFLERCLAFAQSGDDAKGNPVGSGSVAVVTPQNWLFLGTYQKLRRLLLDRDSIDLIARLGTGAFRTISGQVVNVAMPILTATKSAPNYTLAGIDASEAPGPDAKADLLKSGDFTIVEQSRQLQNPDQRIVLEALQSTHLLEDFASSIKGLTTGDLPRFVQSFWEAVDRCDDWSPFQSTVEINIPFGGRDLVFYWCHGKGPIQDQPGARTYATGAWGRTGVLVSQMRALPVTFYLGDPHDNNTAVIVPKEPDHLRAIWAFCSSPEFNVAVRKIDSALKVTNASLVKVPFDLEYWQKIAEERYPIGLPEPYSSDPTQWLFQGTVTESDQPLQVAMARLLGYRWPDQVDDWLDALSDPDGIVCLPSVYQEPAADSRLRDLLAKAYGDAWTEAKLRELLEQVGATSLETWLRDKGARTGFFGQHITLFQNRPFLWVISDGRRDGFAAVVNYHKLTNGTVNKLIYTYLGEWISRQERGVTGGEAGAQGRLEDASKLRDSLIKILTGEKDHDIYVRWKSLAEQPIGWNPDLDDGVRLNIRPFITAGVLAGKVNAKWDKDRGNDPAVRIEPLATGADDDLKKRIELHCSTIRYNDLHFSLAEKHQARALAQQAGEA